MEYFKSVMLSLNHCMLCETHDDKRNTDKAVIGSLTTDGSDATSILILEHHQ